MQSHIFSLQIKEQSCICNSRLHVLWLGTVWFQSSTCFDIPEFHCAVGFQRKSKDPERTMNEICLWNYSSDDICSRLVIFTFNFGCCIIKGMHTELGRVEFFFFFDQLSSKAPTKLAACPAIV